MRRRVRHPRGARAREDGRAGQRPMRRRTARAGGGRLLPNRSSCALRRHIAGFGSHHIASDRRSQPACCCCSRTQRRWNLCCRRARSVPLCGRSQGRGCTHLVRCRPPGIRTSCHHPRLASHAKCADATVVAKAARRCANCAIGRPRTQRLRKPRHFLHPTSSRTTTHASSPAGGASTALRRNCAFASTPSRQGRPARRAGRWSACRTHRD
mmetsp:Transcript_20049/g.60942  ORF Transcript_20049/g.60942 Transcript_20049/m.60942 type:complete len:211 (+) Transcript_20049:3181-3813(+)